MIEREGENKICSKKKESEREHRKELDTKRKRKRECSQNTLGGGCQSTEHVVDE